MERFKNYNDTFLQLLNVKIKPIIEYSADYETKILTKID